MRNHLWSHKENQRLTSIPASSNPRLNQIPQMQRLFDLKSDMLLNQLSFSAAELQAIDQHAVEGGINLWQKPSTDQRP